jgi:hypothetical protein
MSLTASIRQLSAGSDRHPHLGIGWFDLWRALRPVLRLNAALALWGCDLLVVRACTGPLSPVYLAAMTGLRGLVYGILFLTTSDQALTGEAERWPAGLARTLRVRG